MRLVFDVIQPTTPAIKRALQFACGNALVCETAEDARRLAFGGAERHKAVSLDGTMFQKNGVISGGATDLKAKAKRWETAAVNQLRTRRNELKEQITELHRQRRLEQDAQQKRQALAAIEAKIKFINRDKENEESRVLTHIEQELETLRAEAALFEPRLAEINKRIEERAAKISALEQKKNGASDKVFDKFCKRVGIANIR